MLSEERQSMEWVGIFQVRILWVDIFRRWGGIFTGEFDGWEFFSWEFPRGVFTRPIFFIWCIYSYFSKDLSTLYKANTIFINKYKKTFKKVYNFAQNFLTATFFLQSARNIFNPKHLKQWEFWVVKKWEVREKCRS